MKQRVGALIVSLAITGVFSTPAYAGKSFIDVPDDSPYATYIANLKNKGVVNGIGDGKYGPADSLTRAQFAAFLVKAFNLSETKDVPFEDIKGHWATFYIQAAYAAGIVNGTSATTFEPDAKVRREEAATMIWRYLKSKGVDMVTNDVKLDEFVDDWAAEAVKNIIDHNLFGPEVQKGATGWKYQAQKSMTREEMAALIDLAMQMLDQDVKRGDLPLPPVKIVDMYWGNFNDPAPLFKGLTIVGKKPDGSPGRTVQVVDLLNQTDNSSNLIFDATKNIYRIGNIPIIHIRNDGDRENDENYARITENANRAAHLISTVTIDKELGDQESVVVNLPAPPEGLYWKYVKAVPGWPVVRVTDNKMSFPYMRGEGSVFTLYLDTDPNPLKMVFPAAWFSVKNLGLAGDVNLQAGYGTIDIN